MSSLALPREAAAAPPPSGRLGAAIAGRGEAILLAVPIALLALMALLQLPREVNVDSWLALVAGRLVWNGGIPHHETLTVISHGAVWVDQQWLSQLASYAIYRLGGLGLLGVINSGLLVAGLTIVTVAARRAGASFRSTLVILPVCVAMVMPSRELRTQAFAVPLFALLVSLLARDSRTPSRRVFWSLPLLVVWANLHGTVTLGAMLVALHGLITLFERRRKLARSARAWARPLGLLAGPAAAILVTPYGLAIVGYYHATMVSSTLRQAVTEWQPVTSIPALAAGVFAVSGVALWSFGRNPERTTRWEKLALILVAASAIEIVRNSLFLALLATAVVPVSVVWGGARAGARAGRSRVLINGTVAALTVLCLLVVSLATLARPSSTIELSTQRPGVLAAVKRATQANPALHVLADEHYDDWLLWRDPGLAGRIANDVRFEILTAAQIQRLQALFEQVGPGWKRAAQGYRLLVLDKRYDRAAFVSFTHEPGRRILFDDGVRAVILRTAAAAARG